MDPAVTFEALLDALLRGDPDVAKGHAKDLANWIAKKCFVPQVLTDAKTKRSSKQPPPGKGCAL